MAQVTIQINSIFKFALTCYFIVSLCGLCWLKSGNILLHIRGTLGVYSLLSSSGYSYLDFSFLSRYKSTQLHRRSRLRCGNFANSISRASKSHFLVLSGCLYGFLCLGMNSLHHTISESFNFMVYFGRTISSLSRDMPPRVFGLTSSWYGGDETYSAIRQPGR